MGDERDRVELGSGREGTSRGGDGACSEVISQKDVAIERPYLRLWFKCSGQYARAYRSACGSVYVGRCPKCGASSRFRVGAGGTSERFFQVSC